MNIEMLSPEKLKVVLNTGDLDKYDLDYMSISSESRETRVMVRDILARARSSSGFCAKNCKLLIEVLPGKNNGCVLYLTKMPKSGAAKAETETKAVSARSRTRGAYYLSCGCFDDTVGALHCFADYPEVPLLRSSLYDFGGRYHLVFAPMGNEGDQEKLGALLTCLSEYGQTGRLNEVSEAILAEHGNAISSGRAVEKMLRFFY